MARSRAISNAVSVAPLETLQTFRGRVEVTAPASWDESEVRRLFARLLRVDGWPLELVAVTAGRESRL